jgi:hypothetical protein
VSCEHRFRSWDAGAHCLSALRLEIEGPGGRRRAALAVGYGQKRFADRAHRVPGHIGETDGDLDVRGPPQEGVRVRASGRSAGLLPLPYTRTTLCSIALRIACLCVCLFFVCACVCVCVCVCE